MWGTARNSLTVIALLASAVIVGDAAVAAPSPATEQLDAVCSVEASVTPDTVVSTGVPSVVAGESISLSETVRFEEGTVFQNATRLADGSVGISSYVELVALPSPLVVDPASMRVTLGGNELATIAGTAPAAGDWVLETDSSVPGQTTWRAYPPGDVEAMLAENSGAGVASFVVPAGGQDLVMTYTATVPDGGYTIGEVLDGAGCFATMSTGPSNRETDRTRSRVAVVEPNVQLAKSVVGLPVTGAGGIVTYRFTVGTPVVDPITGVAVAPSRDVATIDTVPVGLTPVDQDGAMIADGGIVPFAGSPAANGTWDATARTITATHGDIDPTITRTYEYRTRVGTDVEPGTLLTNTLDATYSSLAGTGQLGDRDFAADPVNVDVTVASAVPQVTKTSDVVRYAPGQPITYTVTATLPAGSSYSNLTLLDTLPDGLTFLAYQTATCTGSASCPTTVESLIHTVYANGETVIGWYPNNIPASATPVTITASYTAADRRPIPQRRGRGLPRFADERSRPEMEQHRPSRFGVRDHGGIGRLRRGRRR